MKERIRDFKIKAGMAIKIIGIFAILILLIILLMNMNEEVIFLITFVSLIIVIVKMFGEVIKIRMENNVKEIYGEFMRLAIAKTIAMNKVKVLGEKMIEIVDDINKILVYMDENMEYLKKEYEEEFILTYILMKHKQLKVLLIELMSFYKEFNIQQSLSYQNELERLFENRVEGFKKEEKEVNLQDQVIISII
jgi:hypothetical protein